MSNETQATHVVESAIRSLISDRLAYLVIYDERQTYYYVQFAPGFVGRDDIDDLYGEAVSNSVLEPPHALDQSQEQVLRRLGWMPPTTTNPTGRPTTQTEWVNWWRYFEVPSSDDVVRRIAKVVVDTFTEVYRSDGAHLRPELAPHQG